MHLIRSVNGNGLTFLEKVQLPLIKALSNVSHFLTKKSLSDESVFEAQSAFERLLDHDPQCAAQLGKSRVSIFLNFMKKSFSELSALNRLKDYSNFQRIRNDYLDYLAALRQLAHYRYLSSLNLRFQTLQKYENEAQKSLQKIESLEDAFACALGSDAVEELHNLRAGACDLTYEPIEKGHAGHRFPHLSAERINTDLYWKKRNANKLSEDGVRDAERRLDKIIQEKKDRPNRFLGYHVYSYMNFAKKNYWELSKQLRYKDEALIRKIRKDYADYLYTLEILNHADYLSNLYTLPKKIKNYETHAQIAAARLEEIEEYFAHAMGPAAVLELNKMRASFEDYNGSRRKAAERPAFNIEGYVVPFQKNIISESGTTSETIG